MIKVSVEGSLATRLHELFEGIAAVVAEQKPIEAAVEETFVNVNPGSTLKLGQARGVVMLAPARAGLPVFEYAANLVKKSVVGAGHADKRQIAMMVGRLLPGRRGKGRCRRRSSRRDLPCPSSRHRPAGGGGALIARLKGSVEAVDEGSAVIDVNGVGYLVSASSRTLRDLVVGQIGDAAGRDHRARGRDRAVRLPRHRRARLVPHPDDGAGRRRQGGAVHPLDARRPTRSPAPSPPATRRASAGRPASGRSSPRDWQPN